MSAGPARYRSWWAKMASTPSRSAMPVTVATSVVSEMAGSARLPTITGWTNSTATCWASVLGSPGAEHDELAAPVKPDRHGVARLGHRARLPGQFPGGIAPQLEQAADIRIVLR